MKKFLLPLLFFVSLLAQSQVYNNEWINYSRTYYKFKVGKDGLFRIPKTASLPLPLSGLVVHLPSSFNYGGMGKKFHCILQLRQGRSVVPIILSFGEK